MSSPPAQYHVRLPPLPEAEAKEAARTVRDRLILALKRERARCGWTRDEAARRAGIHKRRYRRIEEGTAPITLRTLELLAQTFSVQVSALLR